MLDRGDIFLGNVQSKERAFLGAVFAATKKVYQRLVIPCAGKFAAVEAAVQAGWEPSRIEASDVSLFSTVVAHYVNDVPLDSLGVRADAPAVDLDDPPSVLYALKLLVLRHRAKNYFDSLLIRDMERRPEAHIGSLRKSLDALKAKIGGFVYQTRDMWAHLADLLDEPGTLVWVNPPGHFKGYAKMYDTGGAISWAEPEYDEFNPKDGHERLRKMVFDKPALVLRYKYKELSEAERIEAVYGGERSRARVDYILSNRPAEVASYIERTVVAKAHLDIAPIKAAVLPEEHEIRPESKLSILAVEARHALYYRDLFAHKLGYTTSQMHYVILVDGYVFGVFGIHPYNLYHGRVLADGKLYAEETYGFTAPSYRYRRLNRLLMMLVTTRQFLAPLATNIYQAEGLATTCLSEYPELKTNRGILDLISRERMKNGFFKLRYTTLAKDKTYQEVLKEWLSKQSQPSSRISATA